jgi:transposase
VPQLDPRDVRIAELEAKIDALSKALDKALARISELEAENAQLRGENTELRARLGQNSQNSSRPPSSDPPGTPREPKGPTGRARGGQPGHKGHKRERLPPDRVVPVVPPRCDRCQRPLHGRDPDPWIHQVVELPEIRPDVTDYELHELGCECGARTRATLPEGVPQGAFGPRLTAATVLCTSRYRMSKRAARDFVQDLFGINVAVGSVSKMEQFVSEAVAAPVEEARAAAQEQTVAHQDETGWFEGPHQGRKARAWLWVAVTALVTVFRIARSRGADVTKEMLGEGFRGFLVVDRWSAYRWVARGMRQLCWAHLIRDFAYFVDRGGAGGEIGNRLLKFTDVMFQWWHRIRDGTLTRRTFQRRMKRVERAVGRLLRKAAVCGDAKIEGMAKDILKHEPALWTFVYAEGVEPTNNAAERALRTAVIWRKVSFGTDSERGSRFVERILTVLATLKQQKRNVLAYLTDACEAELHRRPPPSLLPSLAPRA